MRTRRQSAGDPSGGVGTNTEGSSPAGPDGSGIGSVASPGVPGTESNSTGNGQIAPRRRHLRGTHSISVDEQDLPVGVFAFDM